MDEKILEEIIESYNKEKKGIERKVVLELKPFIDGIYSMDTTSRNFKLFEEAYTYFSGKYDKKLNLFLSMFFEEEDYSNTVTYSLYLLFLYLGAIESVGNTIVDMLIMLLIANGRDFHIECRSFRTPRIRHVCSIREDLEKERVPLGTKLSFLSENGIKTVTSIIDTKLRNAVAHLKFEIKDEKVYVNRKLAADLTYVALKRLLMVTQIVNMVLGKLAEEKGIPTNFEKKLHELGKKWR
jgi:hypothetical protein